MNISENNNIMPSPENEIRVDFDETGRFYYCIWQPLRVAGAGETKQLALEDVRQAAHLGIDTLIDKSLGSIG